MVQSDGRVAYSETNDLATSVLKALDNGANYYSIAYVRRPKNMGVSQDQRQGGSAGVTVVFARAITLKSGQG